MYAFCSSFHSSVYNYLLAEYDSLGLKLEGKIDVESVYMLCNVTLGCLKY